MTLYDFVHVTCGLFQAHNAYVLSHLVIPKQIGTPDSCEPHNLEEIIAVQDEYGLIFIGWIHVSTSSRSICSEYLLEMTFGIRQMIYCSTENMFVAIHLFFHI